MNDNYCEIEIISYFDDKSYIDDDNGDKLIIKIYNGVPPSVNIGYERELHFCSVERLQDILSLIKKIQNEWDVFFEQYERNYIINNKKIYIYDPDKKIDKGEKLETKNNIPQPPCQCTECEKVRWPFIP